jgi:hypothetical protein
MNLLPTKKWNVWNADNKQKVARDEQEHKEKQEAELSRQRKVESEKRLELLRDRARARSGQPAKPVEQIVPQEEPPMEHITLFNDFAEDSLALTDSKRKQHNNAVCKPVDDEDGTLKKKKSKREDVAPQGVRFGDLPELKGRNSVPRFHKIVNGIGNETKLEEETKKRKRQEDEPKRKKKKTMEELRNERLEREEKERKRSQKL